MAGRELLTGAIVLGAMVVSLAAVTSESHVGVKSEPISITAPEPSAAAPGTNPLPEDRLSTPLPPSSGFAPTPSPTHSEGCPSSYSFGY